MESKRVVVTGLGAITPIGNTVKDFCLRPTKKPKKYAVTKKSCTFAAENEYYLFTKN